MMLTCVVPQHDHVLGVRDVDYIVVDGLHVIVIFQDWEETGSLKDVIHQVSISRRLTVFDSIKYTR